MVNTILGVYVNREPYFNCIGPKHWSLVRIVRSVVSVGMVGSVGMEVGDASWMSEGHAYKMFAPPKLTYMSFVTNNTFDVSICFIPSIHFLYQSV